MRITATAQQTIDHLAVSLHTWTIIFGRSDL